MKLSALALVLLSCLPVEAARFDIADVARIVRVSDPQIAPDGKSIVIVVSRPNYDLNLHQTELVLVDIASHHERMLTHDRKGVSYPRWSPSGDMLAYLASDVNNKGQIFLMPMTGGDSMQLTKVSTGVQQFAWSPDGKSIAFAASEEAPKKTGADRFDDAFEIGNNDSWSTLNRCRPIYGSSARLAATPGGSLPGTGRFPSVTRRVRLLHPSLGLPIPAALLS